MGLYKFDALSCLPKISSIFHVLVRCFCHEEFLNCSFFWQGNPQLLSESVHWINPIPRNSSQTARRGKTHQTNPVQRIDIPEEIRTRIDRKTFTNSRDSKLLFFIAIWDYSCFNCATEDTVELVLDILRYTCHNPCSFSHWPGWSFPWYTYHNRSSLGFS